MKWSVLVSAPYMLQVLEEYKPLFEENGIEVLAAPVRERLGADELVPLIRGVHGVICGDDQFTQEVLQAAPKLKVISKWGTGLDSIDLRAAERLGIRIYNTPGAFTDPVADTVMGYVLLFARQLLWLDRDVRSGFWHKRNGISLRECTLGIVGVGNVGKAVLHRATAFGMRTLGTDVDEVPTQLVEDTGLQLTTLDELLSESDFVSLNCDLNSASYHMIGERELKCMKDTAYLINTCRGPVVDESALVRALREQWIAGAALDVFEEEPLLTDSPLLAFDNCFLAPHNANSSPDAWRRVHESTIQNLIDGLRAGG